MSMWLTLKNVEQEPNIYAISSLEIPLPYLNAFIHMSLSNLYNAFFFVALASYCFWIFIKKKKKKIGRFFCVVVTFYGFSYLVGCYIVFSYLGFACFSGYGFGCLLSLVLSSFYLFIYFFKSLFLSLFV